MGERSRCDRAKIGAIIVSTENRVVATGYNGPPANWSGLRPEEERPREWYEHCTNWCDRAIESAPGEPADGLYANCPANHSEINALMHSSREEREGGSIYVSGSVCMSCAKAIANSGLARVVLVGETADYRNPAEVQRFLESCGIRVVSVDPGR
jgi:dCMP deaminase